MVRTNNIAFRIKSNTKNKTIQYPPINKSDMFIKGRGNKGSSESVGQPSNNQVITIDVKKLNQTLARLRKHSDKLYHEVEGSNSQVRDDFKQMLVYIQLLYNTDNYEVLFNTVHKHFNDLKEVKPGTIGAYFGGCFNNHLIANTDLNNLHAGCIPVCAGSMPPSKSYMANNNWSFCDDTVIWLKYSNDAYTMTILHTIPGSNQALVFLNISDLSQFNGLTEAEKNQLMGVGIQQIKLIGISGTRYVMITPNWIPLQQVKSRVLVGQLVNEDIVPLSKCGCLGSCGCGVRASQNVQTGLVNLNTAASNLNTNLANASGSNLAAGVPGSAVSSTSGTAKSIWWYIVMAIFIIVAVIIILIIFGLLVKSGHAQYAYMPWIAFNV